MAFDRDKFLRVAAMLGSEHEGERHAAADRAYAMLERAGATWFDILNERSDDARDNEIRIRTEACEQLLADLEAAYARIAELERASPDWRPIERVEIGNHRRVSAWLLDLNTRGEVWFSERGGSLSLVVAAGSARCARRCVSGFKRFVTVPHSVTGWWP
jgi:hypothetical protein